MFWCGGLASLDQLPPAVRKHECTGQSLLPNGEPVADGPSSRRPPPPRASESNSQTTNACTTPTMQARRCSILLGVNIHGPGKSWGIGPLSSGAAWRAIRAVGMQEKREGGASQPTATRAGHGGKVTYANKRHLARRCDHNKGALCKLCVLATYGCAMCCDPRSWQTS